MMKMFSRHREWDVPRASGDVSSADLEQAELLLSQLTQPALSQELHGEDAAVAAMGARMRIAAASEPTNAATTSRPAGQAGRVLAASLCVFAATTGAAFAGVLPGPVQDVAQNMLDKIGVTVPNHAANTPDIPAAQETEGTVSNRAHAPGTRVESRGATDSGAAGAGSGGTDGSRPVGSTPSGDPGKGHGRANHGANSAGKNAHGKATSAAHRNGGNAGGRSQTHPAPRGGGAATGKGRGRGRPAGTGGSKPVDAGGG
jgi:hypothetical protein